MANVEVEMVEGGSGKCHVLVTDIDEAKLTQLEFRGPVTRRYDVYPADGEHETDIWLAEPGDYEVALVQDGEEVVARHLEASW